MNVDAIPSGLEHAEIPDRPAEIPRNALAHIPDGDGISGYRRVRAQPRSVVDGGTP
ncbi:hypothetical protein GCM10023205_64330 [Yinghuangia aomiensis]|uniref:Uncharacterized protein n=1 Tax=Yinghuangia aomiensis TaxID=676205 RepID=A0ABP9I1J3_9ACTN